MTDVDTFPYEERMAPRRHPLRNWVLGMYRNGVLFSPREGAEIAGVPRQTVARWIREEKINVSLARQKFVAHHRSKAQRYLDGLSPVVPMTKKQTRRVLAKRMKAWNEANTKVIPIGKRALP